MSSHYQPSIRFQLPENQNPDNHPVNNSTSSANQQNNSHSASSYLRYIQKFRSGASNQNDSMLANQDDNLSRGKVMQHMIAAHEKKIDEQVVASEYSYKRRNPIQSDEQQMNTTFSKGTLVNQSIVKEFNPGPSTNTNFDDALHEMRHIVSSLQTTYDFLHKRIQVQEEGHKDLLRIVKLLQNYNENQDDENTRVREQLRQTDSLVRLIEERLLHQKRSHEQKEDDIAHQFTHMRDEMIRDIKTVGKELALDIVSLNKKIEQRSSANMQRIKAVEANYERYEKKAGKLIKQYNQVHHMVRKIEGGKVTTDDKGAVETKSQNLRDRRPASVQRTIESIQRRSNNHSIIENQSIKARSNSCSLRKRSGSVQRSRPRSNNPSRIQFTSQNAPIPEYQNMQKAFLSDGITPTSNISAPTQPHATQNQTIETDNRQLEIINRISQLENELEYFKKLGSSISPSLGGIMRDTKLSFLSNSKKLQVQRPISPNFSQGEKSINGTSKQRELSNSAIKLRHSLENRAATSLSQNKKYQGLRLKQNALKGVMDISFTSDEADVVSERYFDTVKAQARSLPRTEEPQQRETTTYQKLRPKRKQSHEVGMRQRQQPRHNSLGKKSFDDVLSLVARSIRSRASSKRSTSRITPGPAEANERFLSDYLRQKEEVLKERAQRLLNLSQLQQLIPKAGGNQIVSKRHNRNDRLTNSTKYSQSRSNQGANKENQQRNRSKSQCKTIENPKIYAVVSQGKQRKRGALGSIRNNTISYQ
ncbi:hypothetical protein FGO68_gene8020 [Halteria grandinella]|uniref:Uncharacterized protein n=1 Tax=Halteria grandinella TaxID=5974 RepID=A0A8J8T529_HALGN|nr:hypothetical protein FGO68_gene8020 [Halteria grandinella]